MGNKAKLSIVFSIVSVGLMLVSSVSPEDNSRQELVERLRGVIERAEQDRSSASTVLKKLRDLVTLYDWPWQVGVLDDDFSDGDYEKNPAWIVDRGVFRVARGVGLRSVEARRMDKPRATSKSREDNPAAVIFDALLGSQNEKTEPSSSETASPASEIHTRVKISNAFALKINLVSNAYQTAHEDHFEFGPYVSDKDRSGYRLAYYPGRAPAFELVRVAPGRSSVIEIYNREMSLEDNRTHFLEWRRKTDGEMVILVDGREILRTVDRGLQGDFEGFTVVNRGGDYTFSRIAVFGTERS